MEMNGINNFFFTGEDCGVPGLDVRNFVGTVLDWSGVMEVLDYGEYVQIHGGKPGEQGED